MTENHGIPVGDQLSYNFLFSRQNPQELEGKGTKGLAATVAATQATLDGIRRTVITARALEITVFAGHTGILRYVADVS